MLAKYVEARSPQLDSILVEAGVLEYFSPYVDQATAVPDQLGIGTSMTGIASGSSPSMISCFE